VTEDENRLDAWSLGVIIMLGVILGGME